MREIESGGRKITFTYKAEQEQDEDDRKTIVVGKVEQRKELDGTDLTFYVQMVDIGLLECRYNAGEQSVLTFFMLEAGDVVTIDGCFETKGGWIRIPQGCYVELMGIEDAELSRRRVNAERETAKHMLAVGNAKQAAFAQAMRKAREG